MSLLQLCTLQCWFCVQYSQLFMIAKSLHSLHFEAQKQTQGQSAWVNKTKTRHRHNKYAASKSLDWSCFAGALLLKEKKKKNPVPSSSRAVEKILTMETSQRGIVQVREGSTAGDCDHPEHPWYHLQTISDSSEVRCLRRAHRY